MRTKLVTTAIRYVAANRDEGTVTGKSVNINKSQIGIKAAYSNIGMRVIVSVFVPHDVKNGITLPPTTMTTAAMIVNVINAVAFKS